MKNKHLVLLFLGVLAAGLVGRRLPFWKSGRFEANLVRANPGRIDRVVLRVPGWPELALERGGEAWLATQDDRSVPVPAAVMDTLLATLAQIRSLSIVKTARPDTLGLAPAAGIGVQVFESGVPTEVFYLGREIVEDGMPATYLALPGHEGIYLVRGHLRAVFSLKMLDFRKKTAFRFDPANVAAVHLRGKNDPERLWIKNDSLAVWTNADTLLNCPDEAARAWLRLLLTLNDRPFADGFDETRAEQYLAAEILLIGKHPTAGLPLTLRFFYVEPPELPEDWTAARRRRDALASWVFQSSQSADNYFALADSALARLVCRGLGQRAF